MTPRAGPRLFTGWAWPKKVGQFPSLRQADKSGEKHLRHSESESPSWRRIREWSDGTQWRRFGECGRQRCRQEVRLRCVSSVFPLLSAQQRVQNVCSHRRCGRVRPAECCVCWSYGVANAGRSRSCQLRLEQHVLHRASHRVRDLEHQQNLQFTGSK